MSLSSVFSISCLLVVHLPIQICLQLCEAPVNVFMNLPDSCLRVVHGPVLVSLQLTKILPRSTCGSWAGSCLFATYQAHVYVWFKGLFISLCSLPRSCLRVVDGLSMSLCSLPSSCLRVVQGSVYFSLHLTTLLLTCS